MNGIASLYQMTPTGVPFRTGVRGESTSEQRYFVPGFSNRTIPLTPEQQADLMLAAQKKLPPYEPSGPGSEPGNAPPGTPSAPSPSVLTDAIVGLHSTMQNLQEISPLVNLAPGVMGLTTVSRAGMDALIDANTLADAKLKAANEQMVPSRVSYSHFKAGPQVSLDPNITVSPVPDPAVQQVSPIAPDVVTPGLPVTDQDINVDPTAALTAMNQQQAEEDTAAPTISDVAATVAATVANTADAVDAEAGQTVGAPAPAPDSTTTAGTGTDTGAGAGTPSIGDQQNVDANMNVQDAPNTGGDGGGTSCFLTTAAVRYMGQKDNGEVLNTLRNFRDTYMQKDREKNKDVQWYYTNAPRIMRALDARKDAGPVYREMYNDYIVPAYQKIKAGKNAEAYADYRRLVNFAKRESGIDNQDLTPKPKHYAQGGVASLANQVQERGRGQDTMLVHMTPKEVQGLQYLAMRHGGSLTINPQTGLPEAGFLSNILPMIAGAALAATGVGAPMAALLVGGGYGVATGSLSKGLMAGLGAFGGAGLGGALMGVGAAGAASATAPALTGTAPGLAQAGAIAPQAAMSVAPGTATAGINQALLAGSPAAGAFTPAAATTVAPQVAPTFMGNVSQMGQGVQNLFTKPGTFSQLVGTAATPTTAATGLGGGIGALKTVGMAATPLLAGGFDEPAGLPVQEQYIRPFRYRARPSAEEDAEFRYRTGERGESTAEQRYFGSTYTPVGVYKAGTEPAYGSYARGGDIEEGVKNGNIRSFDDEYGQDEYAGGGLTAFKAGGLQDGGFVVPADVVAHLGNGSTDAGLRLLSKTLKAKPIKGNGDGMSDSIPTTIGGKQPARVADGEAYISPEMTKKVGSERLYAMMDRIRKAKTGKKKQAPEINTRDYVPA